MNILHIDSSALGQASVSREITAAVVKLLRNDQTDSTLTYRDLAAEPINHLGGELLSVMRPAPGSTPEISPALQTELALNEALVGEFLAADTVVIGAPMYNFSVPTQLKAWIDRVAQAGRTFRYTAAGPEGLAGGKKVVIVSSRGGMYAGQAHETAMDHQEAYLRAVLGFFGISDVSVIRAEGVAMGPEARTAALRQALEAADALVAQAA